MIHSPDGPTSPELVSRIASLIEQIEALAAQPFEITRDDDWSISQALDNLRTVVDNNPKIEKGQA